MSKIYLATSGTGKTYFCKKYPGWVDLDGWFFWNDLSDQINENLFIKMVLFYQHNDYNILISSIKTAEYLIKNNIQINGYIIPSKAMKAEIIVRLLTRGPEQNGWAHEYLRHFNKEIEQIDQLSGPKFYLKSGQHVSDIIDSEGNIKINETDN